MQPVSPNGAAIRPPHPLALALIERLRSRPPARVLEIGPGSGRNTAALTAAGHHVDAIDDPARLAESTAVRYAAALSTHALLHGTPNEIAEALEAIAQSLEENAPLFAIFGSVNDARYAIGKPVAPFTFASTDGDEAGIPHAFFDHPRLQRMLETHFTVESLEECDVDTIAGTWAHPTTPLRQAKHWFAIGHRRL